MQALIFSAIAGLTGHTLIKGCKLGLGYCKPRQDLLDSLTNDELFLYNQIKDERKKIALTALIIAIVLSGLLMMVLPKLGLGKSLLKFIGMVFIIMHTTYILAPKGKSLVEVLDSESKRMLWVKNLRMYHELMAYGKLAALLALILN